MEIEPGQIWKDKKFPCLVYIENCDYDTVDVIEFNPSRVLDSGNMDKENFLDHHELLIDVRNSEEILNKFREILIGK